MDLSTATPVEIDTVIAEIYVRYNRARYEAAILLRRVDDYARGLAKKEAGDRSYLYYTAEALEKAEQRASDARAEANEILAEARPFNAEWVRRGRWSRFYLVDNGSGHVHSSMDCKTTFPTTDWVWLPEFSDQDEAGVVALAQSQACTICFPSAPVTKAKGSIENPAKRKSRLEREAAKAEREVKKAAKAIANPDGSPLEVFNYHVQERRVQQRDGSVRVFSAFDRFETLTTLAAAKTWLTDSQEQWGNRKRQADIDRVAEAVAHKLGTSAQAEIDAAAKRAAKRR